VFSFFDIAVPPLRNAALAEPGKTYCRIVVLFIPLFPRGAKAKEIVVDGAKANIETHVHL